MKVKLTVKEPEKFKIACEATDILVLDSKQYGKSTVIQISIKHPSQLYEAGLIQAELNESIPPDLITKPEVKKEAESQPKENVKK